MRDLVSSVTTYEKNLRGFERVSLDPGRTKRVSFELGPMDLRLMNEQWKWVVEPGEFQVMAGASSEDIKLDAMFAVAQTRDKLALEKDRLEKHNLAIREKIAKTAMIDNAVKVTDHRKDVINAFDDNLATWWSTPNKGAEMIIALKEGANPDCVKIAWYKGGERRYKFEIQRNAGGGQWVPLSAVKVRGKTDKLEIYKFKPDGVSEIKIVFWGNSENQYSAVTEIQVPGLN